MADVDAKNRKPRVEFVSGNLYCYRHLLSDSIMLTLHKRLQEGSGANWYHMRSSMKGPINIPTNTTNFELELTSGRKPSAVMLVFVKATRTIGDFGE